jgi:tetratricopeptide (TPR) repeat protein
VVRVVALGFAGSQGAARLSGLQRASSLAPSIWRYDYDLGSFARAVGRYDEALARLDAAIEKFPACGICWVAKAEAEASMGADPRASIARAIHYGRSQTGVRTRTAVLYAKLGEHTEALREFGAAAGGQVDNPYEFFSALHALYDTKTILDQVVPDAQLESYFTYARQYLDVESTATIWERFREMPEAGNHRQYYAGDLLRRGDVHAAWRTSFGRDAPVAVDLFDAGFSSTSTKQPWGWRLEDGEGVRVRTGSCADCEQDGRALHIEFDGENNPHFMGVSQYLPVLPGAAYLLKARVKYDGLTSARGPAMIVQGVTGAAGTAASDCHFWIEGEQFLMTSDWRATQVAFAAPSSCEGVRVMVARPQTSKLNRYIAGDLWVDDVHLEILTLPSQSAEQPTESPALASLATGG